MDTAFKLREGEDITLLSWGAMLVETLEAAERLSRKGIDCEVIDIATLKPYDEFTIKTSVEKTGRCVIIHEAARTSGFGAELSAYLAEHCLYFLKAPIYRVTGYDTVMPLYQMENSYMPSVEQILKAANRAMTSD